MEAIRRAQESGEPLIFLYVVDANIISEYDEDLMAAVHAEFHWLGQVLLRVARQRAERAGVEAEISLREGEVKVEIERFLRENKASCLILGAPRLTTPDVFGDDAIEQFAEVIHKDTGVPVDVVHPGA